MVVPDSRHLRGDENPGALGGSYVDQTEKRTLASVAVNNLSAGVTALTYAHPAAVDSTSTTRYRPHAANLTRDTVIRSAAPAGVRGHVMFTRTAKGHCKNVEFRQLGRTTWQPLDTLSNHIGRYSCHVHHLDNDSAGQFDGSADDPADAALGNRFLVEGCAVWDDAAGLPYKYGVVVHASHWCKVSGNVVHGIGGSGIGAESGNERGNYFKQNFCVGVIGTGGRPDERSATDIGYEGAGCWDRNWLNRWDGNIVANCTYGAQFWMSGNTSSTVPTAPASGVTEVVNVTNIPAAGFDR